MERSPWILYIYYDDKLLLQDINIATAVEPEVEATLTGSKQCVT